MPSKSCNKTIILVTDPRGRDGDDAGTEWHEVAVNKRVLRRKWECRDVDVWRAPADGGVRRSDERAGIAKKLRNGREADLLRDE